MPQIKAIGIGSSAMGMLTVEQIGPDGERLAGEAAGAVGVAVGFDPDLRCATFDSAEHDDEALQAEVFEALARIDPDWETQLRLVE